MGFELPSREKVGYLPPEIAGEGMRVINSEGEAMNWAPPPEKPVIPDISQIKSIRHYFNRHGHVSYPAWVYHPSEPPRIVKTLAEAKELGIFYREASPDEKARYGITATWDWTEDCLWRPKPYSTKFDPKNPGQGKTVIKEQVDHSLEQNKLLEALIPQVAAAVAAALKIAAPSAPASVDPKDWSDYQEFLSWKKTHEAVSAMNEPAPERNALSLDPEIGGEEFDDMAELAELRADAIAKGLKVDRRWGKMRLQEEIAKAA